MLVINYSGNKPQCDRFKFSVNGDNNSQTIKFVLKKQQGDIDLSSPLFSIYFLCQSQDKRFVDKAEIESFVVEGNDIILEYKLLGKHTQFKAIDVGLSFEDENQEVVYKTANATISIQNGIMADQEIPNIYPSVIKQMEKEIEKTNVKLQEKATVFKVDDDFDGLETWLNTNDEPIKNGDVISSTSEQYNGIVEISSDTTFVIRVLKDNMVSVYTYIIKDEEWVFDNQQDFPFGGQGLVFDKQYIFTASGVEIVDDIPEGYTGSSFWFGSDGFFYIEEYVNGDLISSTEYSFNNINVNGIQFAEKVTIFTAPVDEDSLDTWLNENFDKLNVGDMISCNGTIYNIDTKSNSIFVIVRQYSGVETKVIYNYDSVDNTWFYYETQNLKLGTKLYKHTLFDSVMDYHFTLISTSATPLDFNTLDTYLKVYNAIKDNMISFTDESRGVNLQFNKLQNYFYGYQEYNGTLDIVYDDDWNLSATTDTVSEL